MTIKILLADDHQIFRQGLRVLLEAVPDFEVVGETGDGLDVVRLVEKLQPDVLVLDLLLPGLHGLEITRQLEKKSTRTRVIILSMHENEGYVLEALRYGAVAYVLKKSDASELVHAIREAVAGRSYLGSPFSQRAIETYKQKTLSSQSDSYGTLTTREREVLQLAAEGYSNAEISQKLGISVRTVEGHRAHLMQKLNLHTQTELIRYALWRGILPLEP